MDLKKRLYALAVVPVLCLFVSAALADVSGLPNWSGNEITPEFGEIKNRNQCDGGTFFKNAFPSLTNGNPGGSDFVDFTVEGENVRVTVTWYPGNSFDFAVDGGYAKKVGVTVDQNNFIYDYSVTPEKGIADTQLNYYTEEINGEEVVIPADDVNHLDLCLETLDTDAPEVGIRVEPSSDGTTVSGIVSIIATIIDESPVNVGIEIVSVDGSQTITVCDPNDPDCEDLLGPDVSGNEYTWTWDTSTVPSGEYTITVDATDTSALLNEGTASLTVTVSIENCLEGEDEIPPGEVGEGGCNPSGFQIIELPNELDNLLDGKTLTQAAAPATLQTDRCGGPVVDPQSGLREFPFVGQDPRVDEFGNLINGVSYPLDLADVFDLSGGFAPNGVRLRADTVGSPCLVLIFGDANFSFAEFYDPNIGAPLQNSGAYTYTVTQLPEAAGLEPLSGVGPLSPAQTDLQLVPQATYQPDNRILEPFVEQEASPFTNEVFNPARKKTPEFSWFVLGTLEVCLSLDPALPESEAVLQCKTDLAIEYFDNLELVLNLSEPYLLSPSLNNLLTDLNKARSMVKVGRWNKATKDLTDLLNQVVGGLWTVDELNYPGNIVMRIENLLWRIAQLDEAEDYLP